LPSVFVPFFDLNSRRGQHTDSVLPADAEYPPRQKSPAFSKTPADLTSRFSPPGFLLSERSRL